MGRIIVIIPEKIWLNGIELAIPGKDSGQWRRIRKKSLAKIVPEIPKAAKVSDPDIGFEAGNSSCPWENQGAWRELPDDEIPFVPGQKNSSTSQFTFGD
jgi:hypothetical protein